MTSARPTSSPHNLFVSTQRVSPSVRNNRNLPITLGIQFGLPRYRPIFVSGVGDRHLSDVTGTRRQTIDFFRRQVYYMHFFIFDRHCDLLDLSYQSSK